MYRKPKPRLTEGSMSVSCHQRKCKQQQIALVFFGQMKPASHLPLNGPRRKIGNFLVSCPIQKVI
jgi:hypothetical protein